ncbi:MAG: Na+/H+ antiporter NhaA [Alphaproteobacteria bacterium]|nr:MAG: Na+/H+ antiporter NhaA [Alphaproteobacteria bacterium]
MPLSAIREFFKWEAAGGILLIIAAALALVLDNSPLASLYDRILTLQISVSIGEVAIAKPLLLWINDGLMAVFFLLIGLEVKREILEGELSSRDQIVLPLAAAVGGMVVPALIYVAFNRGNSEALAGWAIPAATDIAFALGILSLLGSRVPTSLKVFLTALAIIDDLGAIIIIAMFYTANLSTTALTLAALAIAGLVTLNRFGVNRLAPYVLVGALLWVFVLKSGVHATLAGVAVGLAVPLRPRRRGDRSLLRHLEHELHPWVAFMILPLFAFANAGLHLLDLPAAGFVDPVALGIATGLFVGKQIGVFGFAAVLILLGLARMPEGANWRGLYGVSVLTGIGFTMSLFIGTLAFDDIGYANTLRLGVLGGSLASAVLGYLVLGRSGGRRRSPDPMRTKSGH